ncbi:MAG: heavy metal translocating P-type ATPase metal-binding domain-containing protein [Bacteroidota bacterium]|nr:heavy metal translocating P-type ATPase [Odoribacter sp.]MDP3644519.1 heavy metal translocating P-type ATPase metal-binding domain-containing protein [Bacteroidota bacterium]
MNEDLKCIHCGNSCGKTPILFEGNPFCCTGCSSVFQILNVNQLKQYYQIEPMAGIRIEDDKRPANETYAFLELEKFKTKILSFSEGGISKVSFFIPEIHCASCIWLLENLHSLNAGVIQSFVNFPKKEINITFRENEIQLRQLVELLVSIHYIPEISQHSIEKPQTGHLDKKLFLKIGVAAFSFMNAMIYHFPQYLPGHELLEDDIRRMFGWLSVLLAIPVLTFSASDYFLTAWKSLKKGIISIDLPIALGLITLFTQSLAEILSGKGIGYIDSLTGLVFFMLIGRWYQGKTYQALSFERDYKTYFPLAVTKISASGNETIPLEDLQSGDRILVRNQEIVPADSILIIGVASIDYSFVTGESKPVLKHPGDFVFAGGRQIGAAIELTIEKEVQQSYLTQLWNQSENPYTASNKLNTVVNRVSQYFTVIVVLIAIGSGIFWLLNKPEVALFAFTSVLIIACPCALALTVPFTFGSAIRQFGRKGFYLKNTAVIEHLYKVDTVVFDKTGTITNTNSSAIRFVGPQLSGEQLLMIKSLAFQSSHPLSKAICESIEGNVLNEVIGFQEIPSLGISGMVKGIRINMGSRYFVTGETGTEENLKSEVWVFFQDSVIGHFQLENEYRPGLHELIGRFGKKYQLHLLTGDNEAEKSNLIRYFGNEKYLHFNQSPTDKLNYIRKLQKDGRKVLMIGDGLNDAGALNESNVGIVIADNVFNFSPACDAILQSKQFGKLHRFIDFTHQSMKIVKAGFLISFLYNLIGLSFAVQGNLTPIIAAILMPISSVSVVVFASFSVNLAAKGFRF